MGLHGNFSPPFRIPYHQIRIAAHGDGPLARIQTEDLRGLGAGAADEGAEIDSAATDALGVEEFHTLLHARYAVGDEGEVPGLARGLEIRIDAIHRMAHALLCLEIERSVIGSYGIYRTIRDFFPQELAMLLRADRRTHDIFRPFEIGKLGVAAIECQIGSHRFDPCSHAAAPRGCDHLDRRDATGVHHIDLGSSQLRKRHQMMAALRLHRHRARGFMPLRAGPALGD